MRTTPQLIASEKDYQTFADRYNQAFGDNFLRVEFLRGCEEVYLFFDTEGNAIGGYL